MGKDTIILRSYRDSHKGSDVENIYCKHLKIDPGFLFLQKAFVDSVDMRNEGLM